VARSKEEARARAEEVVAKLAGGEDWEAVKEEYSDGDVQFRGEGYDEAAYRLAPGESSGVVETDGGFFVIRREMPE